MMRRRFLVLGSLALVAIGCSRSEPSARPAQTAAAYDPATWQPPPESAIPNDSLGAAIRRGLALIVHTTDSLPRYAPGRISCRSCHLAAGRDENSAPLIGSHVRYPRYLDRAGAVVTMIDRVNYCFTRSLAGRRLPPESREMADILAYLAFLSKGIPTGATARGGLPPMRDTLVGDTTRGAAVFRSTCASCHGTNGDGTRVVPALWGPHSYAISASMAREERAASFIWHNMPLGRAKTLTQQQAFDVAAYVNAQPRPDAPGKEKDWPAGTAPADVPYDTRGHTAHRPPPLLPRAHPDEAVVPAPPRAGHR